jgi:YidC/Oxa1 family membrane protein insertase
MDKRVFIAAGLSVVILIAWQALFMPDPPPPAPVDPTQDDAVVDTVELQPSREAETERLQDQPVEPGVPAPAEAVQAERVSQIVVSNEIFELELTNRGGIATSWRLRDATTGFEPLELLPRIEPDRALTLGIELDDAALTGALNEALYQVERMPISGSQGRGSGERITFTWADGLGVEARKSLTFRRGEYLVEVELDVRDRGRRLPARLVLGPGFGEQEQGAANGKIGTYYYEAVVWKRAGEVTHRKKGKVEEPGGVTGPIPWAGLEDQYFAALVLPDEPAGLIGWRSVELIAATMGDEEEPREPELYPILAVSIPASGAQLFVGPKKYHLLESLEGGLEEAVWFSSSAALAWISRGIFFGLLWIHDHTIPNYGLAIVLCTFLLRVLLFPVNQYSMVSMKKTQLQMARLQPKIKAIKNKYKKTKDAESRAKMNQEMMALYKREGVNPMGGVSGCLPLLAQFPILIAFYFMLTVAVELRGAPFFGWIQDLSMADPYWVTPLLMGATMFLQQKMAMSKVKDPQQQQQQKIMMIMPFVFTWICLQMPAGMVLYWFVNNILGIGQQWLVNRQTTRLEAAQQKA